MNYLRIIRCCKRESNNLYDEKCKVCSSIECEKNICHNAYNCQFCAIPYLKTIDNNINICQTCQLQQMNILLNKYEGSVYKNNIMEVIYTVERKLSDGTIVETYLPEEEKYVFRIPIMYKLNHMNSFPGLFKHLIRPNKHSKYGIIRRDVMVTSYKVKEIIIERHGIRYELYNVPISAEV